MALARAHRVLLLRVNHSRCCACRDVGLRARGIARRPSPALRAASSWLPSSMPDVLDAREILARVGEPAFGFPAPLLVLRDAGRFLEKDAQLFGLGLDDARDHSLLDDRVGARAEAGAEEEVVDVAAAHRNVVDVVGRIAVARQHALDRQLGVLAPLAADAPWLLSKIELDRRAADRLAVAGAVEDHVLHRLAAQRRCLRFAEHPAHGVDDVGLAAAVRADDADELARRGDRRRIDERLEAGELDLGEAQGGFRRKDEGRDGLPSSARRQAAKKSRNYSGMRGSRRLTAREFCSPRSIRRSRSPASTPASWDCRTAH